MPGGIEGGRPVRIGEAAGAGVEAADAGARPAPIGGLRQQAFSVWRSSGGMTFVSASRRAREVVRAEPGRRSAPRCRADGSAVRAARRSRPSGVIAGEGAAPVGRALVALHEPGGLEAVDPARHAAAAEQHVVRELAHPQPVALGAARAGSARRGRRATAGRRPPDRPRGGGRPSRGPAGTSARSRGPRSVPGVRERRRQSDAGRPAGVSRSSAVSVIGPSECVHGRRSGVGHPFDCRCSEGYHAGSRRDRREFARRALTCPRRTAINYDAGRGGHLFVARAQQRGGPG